MFGLQLPQSLDQCSICSYPGGLNHRCRVDVPIAVEYQNPARPIAFHLCNNSLNFAINRIQFVGSLFPSFRKLFCQPFGENTLSQNAPNNEKH